MLAETSISYQEEYHVITTQHRTMRTHGQYFQHGVGGGATGKVQVSATASRLAYPSRPPVVSRLNLQRRSTQLALSTDTLHSRFSAFTASFTNSLLEQHNLPYLNLFTYIAIPIDILVFFSQGFISFCFSMSTLFTHVALTHVNWRTLQLAEHNPLQWNFKQMKRFRVSQAQHCRAQTPL